MKATALIPAPIRALWKEAANFIVCVLLQVDRDKVRAGIDRTQGARLSIWLSGAECALRRLILIAAFAFTPAPLKPQPARKPASRASTAPRGFRVFHVLGVGDATRTSRHTERPPVPYGHLRFAADPMLALGRNYLPRITHRHNGGPVMPRVRLRNPLDRWGRLSRDDPDWRPPESNPHRARRKPEPQAEPESDDDFAVDYDRGFYYLAAPRGRRPRIIRDSRPDWRRCYDEWNRLVPAPSLAARLDALNRIIADPAAIIRRTARRLLSNRKHTKFLVRDAYPKIAMPRRARHVVTSGHAQELAHAAQVKLDTS